MRGDAEQSRGTEVVAVNGRAITDSAASVVNGDWNPHEPVTLADAYAYCSKIARTHYENFTIASWLMPRRMRPHMHVIYAYARIADDFADEAASLSRLDDWEHELDLAYAGTPHHPVFVALAETVRRFDIPREPFADLLRAFRSDVNFKGFDTIDDLLGYARCSANPVGRLVLYLFGYRDPEQQRLSDQICSGLQLANFWQDIAIDLKKGRIYLPRRDLNRFGVTVADLQAGRVTRSFVALMRHEVEYARSMLLKGAALHKRVDRRLSRDILMFAGGGLAILAAIERVGFDVFQARPQLRKLDYLKIGLRAMGGRLGV
jgi:squalene synthase HpnC